MGLFLFGNHRTTATVSIAVITGTTTTVAVRAFSVHFAQKGNRCKTRRNNKMYVFVLMGEKKKKKTRTITIYQLTGLSRARRQWRRPEGAKCPSETRARRKTAGRRADERDGLCTSSVRPLHDSEFEKTRVRGRRTLTQISPDLRRDNTHVFRP